MCELLNRNYKIYIWINSAIFIMATSHLVVALTLELEGLEKSMCAGQDCFVFQNFY